jgi:protein N-terminal amidase
MEAQQQSNRNIKALLCQISPFYKDKIKTINRIKISLERYSPKNELDILVFPEMSFLGYNFENFEDALQYAVQQNEGIEFDFVKELAARIKAYVAFGYIEKVQTETETSLYNSAAVIDRSGNLICNYRKSHLYYNDKLWAKAG